MGILNRFFVRSPQEQATLLNLKGIALAEKGNYKAAQELFEQSINLAPNLPHPRICLSNILLQNGRYSKAEEQLRFALNLNPDDKTRQDALINLANVRIYQKRFHEAVQLIEQAMDEYPVDNEIYYNAGVCLEQLGEWDRALENYHRSKNSFRNAKAQMGIDRLKQRMWQSPEMVTILSSYEGLKIQYPKCGNYSRYRMNQL